MPVSRREFLGGSALLAATFALRPADAPATGSASAGTLSELDAAAAAALASGACPGTALQIMRDGRSLYARQYGWTNLETRTPVAAGSIFRIGSLTKQFTAGMIVKLAAEGRLDLDDPAAKYLSFFAGKKEFTLRELLNHTAGLHEAEDSACPGGSATAKSQVELARDISAQKKLFDFDPGTAWLYSNANYIVLGAVVEKVSGLPLADAATSLIFKPLGLGASAFDTAQAVVPGRVSGYSRIDGRPGSYHHADFIDIAEVGGAGAMRSTTDDLCRWHHALFTQRLFDTRFVAMMTTPGRLRDGRASSSHRYSAADNANYGDTQYGMGLLLPPPSAGHRSVIHYGFINGFAAFLETFIDVGLTTAILCNGDVGPDLPFRSLRGIVAKKLLPDSAL